MLETEEGCKNHTTHKTFAERDKLCKRVDY